MLQKVFVLSNVVKVREIRETLREKKYYHKLKSILPLDHPNLIEESMQSIVDFID